MTVEINRFDVKKYLVGKKRENIICGRRCE
jgi:hypothetical protein